MDAVETFFGEGFAQRAVSVDIYAADGRNRQ